MTELKNVVTASVEYRGTAKEIAELLRDAADKIATQGGRPFSLRVERDCVDVTAKTEDWRALLDDGISELGLRRL